MEKPILYYSLVLLTLFGCDAKTPQPPNIKLPADAQAEWDKMCDLSQYDDKPYTKKHRAKYCQNPNNKGMWYENTWPAIVESKIIQKQAIEAEAKRQAEAEAKRQAAEAEAKRQVEAEAKRQAEAEAKRQAVEAEAKRQAEIKARHDAVYQEAKNIKDIIIGCYIGAKKRMVDAATDIKEYKKSIDWENRRYELTKKEQSRVSYLNSARSGWGDQYTIWQKILQNIAKFTEIKSTYQDNKLQPTTQNITTLKALLTEMKKHISKRFLLNGGETFHEEMNTHLKTYYSSECGTFSSK